MKYLLAIAFCFFGSYFSVTQTHDAFHYHVEIKERSVSMEQLSGAADLVRLAGERVVRLDPSYPDEDSFKKDHRGIKKVDDSSQLLSGTSSINEQLIAEVGVSNGTVQTLFWSGDKYWIGTKQIELKNVTTFNFVNHSVLFARYSKDNWVPIMFYMILIGLGWLIFFVILIACLRPDFLDTNSEKSLSSP